MGGSSMGSDLLGRQQGWMSLSGGTKGNQIIVLRSISHFFRMNVLAG